MLNVSLLDVDIFLVKCASHLLSGPLYTHPLENGRL